MQKKRTLRRSFRTELESESQRSGWGPKDRVQWILDHLDEYIERWLGFANLHIEPRSLIHSDLFTVIEVAIEGLEHELAHSSGSLGQGQLLQLKAATEALREHGTVEFAVALKTAVAEVKASLSPPTR